MRVGHQAVIDASSYPPETPVSRGFDHCNCGGMRVDVRLAIHNSVAQLGRVFINPLSLGLPLQFPKNLVGACKSCFGNSIGIL